jgi:Domain of unknown function (DUF1835)
VLHVLNGDATATVFAEAGVAGERLVWRDILVEGPVPAVPGTPAMAARAAYLTERLGIDADEYVRGVEAQTARLTEARGHDEVVLWFEQDLFCAVTLWSLLDWFTRHAPAAPLSLVYPAPDGAARGLGAMEPSRLAALFVSRRPVAEQTRTAGAQAWAAYAGPDPLASAAFVGRDTPALPFVAGAFRCHFGRFPSLANGLNEVESATLDVLRRGRRQFSELFREVSAHPGVRLHGMGDVQFAACLRGLDPLVHTGDDAVDVTERGLAVLAGHEDWLGIRPIDTWLGGVHLGRDRPLWRWDGAHARLVAASAQV